MVAVVLVVGGLPLAVQVAIGVVVYGLASIALRTVSVDDLRRDAVGMMARSPLASASRRQMPAIDRLMESR